MNPQSPDTRADDAHDPWLDLALRHAPDARADAPAALSDAILRRARSAVARPVEAAATPVTARAPPAPRRRSHPWRSAWAWLTRPPVAAGFGSVMVATLVGVLWWGRPLEEALPGEPLPAPAPAASAPASATASVPQTRVAPAAATAVISGPVAKPTATPAPATPLPPTSSSRQADQALPKAPQEARAARREASPPAAEYEAATATATATAAAAPALQGPAPPAAPGAPATETAPAAAPSLMDQRTRASAAPAADMLSRALVGQAETGAGAGRRPLTGLLAAVAREPERWRWQRDAGTGTGTGIGIGIGTSIGRSETQAMSPNLQRWLAEVDRATASQWRPAADGAARAGPPALRLLRDGVLQATLSFGPAVFIETAGDAAPKTSTAALSSSALEALTKALEEATR